MLLLKFFSVCKSAVSHEIAICNATVAEWFIRNEDLSLAAPCYPVKLPNSRRAGGLFRGNLWSRGCVAGAQRESFTFFLLEISGSRARLHTPAGCCLGESPHPSFLSVALSVFSSFWWNQRKSTSSRRQTTHPSLFFPLSLFLYSIILSDGPLLWALAPLLIPISEKQRGPLVCRHASSNWIIPEIWARAQKGICN